MNARHPGADDTLLTIEVADSSLPFDRGKRATLYARHGIPEYWVLDLRRTPTKANTIVYAHRDPSQNGYQRTKKHLEGSIEAECIDGVAIDDMAAL